MNKNESLKFYSSTGKFLLIFVVLFNLILIIFCLYFILFEQLKYPLAKAVVSLAAISLIGIGISNIIEVIDEYLSAKNKIPLLEITKEKLIDRKLFKTKEFLFKDIKKIKVYTSYSLGASNTFSPHWLNLHLANGRKHTINLIVLSGFKNKSDFITQLKDFGVQNISGGKSVYISGLRVITNPGKFFYNLLLLSGILIIICGIYLQNAY